MIIEELTKILEGKQTLYEFIANNYYKLTKEELKELVLNLDYALVNTGQIGEKLEQEMIKETIERLED